MNRAASYHQHVFLCCCRKIRIPAQKGQFFQILYCKRIQSSMNQIRTNKQHCNMSSCQLWQVWLQITAWTLSKAATFYPNVFLFLPELLNLLFVLLKQKNVLKKQTVLKITPLSENSSQVVREEESSLDFECVIFNFKQKIITEKRPGNIRLCVM